jgi:DNA polymerase-4
MILHMDLDTFFASAHRIDDPSLRGIPIAVGGRSNLNIFDAKKQTKTFSYLNGAFASSLISKDDSDNENYFLDKNGIARGVVTTSSYEARALGVKTAMSVSQALKICPTLKMVKPNYPLYHELSNKLKLLLEKEIPSIEQFSIDEFFGDVTGWINDADVYKFAVNLKDKIQTDLGLPISIGIAQTKWIAKLATNDAKPHGVFQVLPNQVENYIKDKPLYTFPGIGKAFMQKLSGRGISTLGDLKDKKELLYSFGKNGQQIYDRVFGLDSEKISAREDKKSIGLGRSIDPEMNREEIKRKLIILCRHLSFIAYKGNYNPTSYGLKVKYQYGESSNDTINTNREFSEQNFKQEITALFPKVDKHPSHAITFLNVSLGSFQSNSQKTFDLFSYEEDNKLAKLSNSMQALRDKFGVDIIKSGSEL